MPTMDLRALGTYFRRVATRIGPEVAHAVQETLDDLQETAQDLSSGPRSAAELARLDHPYARRHPGPQLDPTEINIQHGDFVSAWEQSGPEPHGTGIGGQVRNTAPYARYLYDEESDHADGGTDRMWGRPVHHRAEDEVRPRFERRVQEALERAAEG